jgi:hypothetical protein
MTRKMSAGAKWSSTVGGRASHAHGRNGGHKVPSALSGYTGRWLLAACLVGVAVAALFPTTSTADAQASSTVYLDAIGDAGDAPDVARVTIRPVKGGLAVDVTLAEPTRLGPYGWILFGIDTDRNPYTGAGRGDELLLFVNGEGATFTRWRGGEFSPDFAHRDVQAAFSGTDLAFVLSWADIGARSFIFSVATLREDADLAPGFGIAAYPRARPARAPAHRRRHALRSGRFFRRR